ncbi:8-amino-7-oxononanoate synthase [Pseudarthrobacter sp. P1]|uniref:8-amino-7-oxononanoate synthase n=1 Tax=Pseudarthrobacter sp. P1 TaxID=3418418 RepID=UPI003CF4EB62
MTEWLQGRERVRITRGLVRGDAVRGGTGRSPLLDLASNDYLGLSTDPRLAAAAIAAIHRHGTGARASRVVTGTSAVHLELESELCALTGAESALSFSSGYAANLGLLGALGGPGTLIVLDEHIHASLIDAARLSRAEVASCAHSDLAQLRTLLSARTQPRAVVVLESVYSVLGDAAPLVEAARLCAQFDALLVVDEAHGIGVTGAGAGSVHAAGLAGRDGVVVTATLSKALGAQGGAVLGSALLRRHLVNTARTFIFDTGLAPAAAAAAAAACRIIGEEPDRVAAVSRNAALLAAGCGTEAAAGAVQSIKVGRPERALAIASRLQDQGLLVGCFRPPSVPDGVSRLRLTARADLSAEQMRHAAALVSAALADEPAVTSRGGAA